MTLAHYPSYKSLDDLIDIERLKSLDQFVRTRIAERIEAARDVRFYTGPFLRDEAAHSVPGPRMVYLSKARGPDDYYKLDQPDYWQPSEDAAHYAPLMDFIATLPFKATGRMLIIYDDSGRAVPAHRDHDSSDLCHEFIWFRTSLTKPFYMIDPVSDEKLYVASHSAWFDTVNQFHGADANGELSISIRVDGIFSDAFRAQIPFPSSNRSAAPSLWAAGAASTQ